MKSKFKSFLESFFEILRRPEMGVLPGQLAFFFILSLVPTITIISYIASFLSLSLKDVASYFNMALDSYMIELLTPVLENSEMHSGLLFILIVGTYIASNGTNSIIITADNIYGIEQNSFLQRRIKAIVMVFIIILLFIFILIVPIFGNFLLSVIERVTGYRELYNLINVIKMPFSWLVIFIFIKILYTIAPDKQLPSSHVNIGALFTSFGWILSTELFLYYVKNFGNYSLYYSGLSNIAILMMWMYILATIFVLGLAINYKEEPRLLEKNQLREERRVAKKNHNIN